jgi:peroxiredoxin
MKIPNITFKTRVGDLAENGECTFENGKWVDVTTTTLFQNKKVILFSLPGAFTPTCTSQQLPGFETHCKSFKISHNIDEVYCVSVNDSYVMNAWAHASNIQNVKMIPDGNGELTKALDMLVTKEAIGFGYRSWRYAAVINDCEIEKMFIEPGRDINDPSDPYGVSSPENVLSYLQSEEIKRSV